VSATAGELAGVIGGISLAAGGFGAIFLLPGRLSSSYEKELGSRKFESTSTVGGFHEHAAQVLAKYTARNLAQSWTSFIVSIIFASVGFLCVAGGVAIVTFEHKSLSTAALPVISGVVVEAVSGLFFTINSLNQKNTVEFFDKLRHDRCIDYSLETAGKLSNDELSAKLQTLLTLQLSGIDNIPDLFHELTQHYGPLGGTNNTPAQRVPKPRERDDPSVDQQ
jgi:hypothetical protein